MNSFLSLVTAGDIFEIDFRTEGVPFSSIYGHFKINWWMFNVTGVTIISNLSHCTVLNLKAYSSFLFGIEEILRQ